MGNNASQSNNVAQRQHLEQEQQWAHSFPRTPQRVNQHKVLPDVSGDVHQKLRPTNNGEILYAGGTISGRHHSSSLSLPRDDIQNGVHRSSSVSSKHQQEYDHAQSSPKHFLIHQHDQVARSSPQRCRNFPSDLRHPHGHHSHQRELQMKRFGSVPDLRGRDLEQISKETRDHVNRTRKKYKAPAPPATNAQGVLNGSSLDSWDMNTNGDVSDAPMRRTRLFKTRAEMKKKPQSPQDRRNTDNHIHNVSSDEPKRFGIRSKDSQKKTIEAKNDENVTDNKKKKSDGNCRIPISEMQRSKSLPEFQAELREATQRLRSAKFSLSKREDRKGDGHSKSSEQKNKNVRKANAKESKLKTLDPNVCKKEHIKYKMKRVEKEYSKGISSEKDNADSAVNQIKAESNRHKDVAKESTPEISSDRNKSREQPDIRDQPSKTFYFGMDDSAPSDSFNNNVVDHFAQSLQKHNCIFPTHTYSGSDLSSEIDADDSQLSTNGIALHLRPILPKKQLEIPRFSPAAAWRLLSAFDSNPPPSTVSDEGPVLIEDRIEKFARQPPPLSIAGVGPRSSHDKSGDSGISGDAGPPGYEDNSDPLLPTSRNNNIQMPVSNGPLNLSWTPQQDLEEESSSEGGVNNNNRHIYMRPTANVKFSPRSQVFSLSLPRDNHLAAYLEEKTRQYSPPSYTNLKRLKRSVSGVLGNFSTKKDSQLSLLQEQSDNWFLSRSAPNSLNNGFNSLEMRLSKNNNNNNNNDNSENNTLSDPVGERSPFTAKLSQNCNGGRVMYLPECRDNDNFRFYQKENCDLTPYKSEDKKDKFKTMENDVDMCTDLNKNTTSYRFSVLSKSCENISSDVNIDKFPFEPENLQDPPQQQEEKWKGRKPKRFTFQSTVRQIERRRLAEKLSREAERKEQQRLSELEAMRRVEEEFQKKRAKEKASIRQQLRLFSLEDTTWSNLTPNWDNKDMPTRSEPDGAVSSSASSPTLDSSSKLESKHLGSGNELESYNDNRPENLKESCMQKSYDSKNSPTTFKRFVTRQGSESSDDARLKAQATQVLSEYRQARREYKDYRGSSRCVAEGTDAVFHGDAKQTTVHPKVIYNMPKAHAHQGSSTDGSSRSNNYRRDFAHGIMLPNKNSETYSEDSHSNIRKHSPRIAQNQRTRQGKCIS